MKEKSIHSAIAQYLKWQYPDVVFTSESSGLRTSIGVAKQLKSQRSAHKLPDLIIMEPRGQWYGLAIELKTESPFKIKGGALKAGRAVEQSKTLESLRRRGYYACFGVGFDKTKELIDWYMSFDGPRIGFTTPEQEAERCEKFNKNTVSGGAPKRCLRCHESTYHNAWEDYNKQMK